MLSDTLYESIREIDRYLKWDTCQVDGEPDPEIVRVRNDMFKILVDPDFPDDLLTPEGQDAKKKMLAEMKTPSWRPWVNA